MNAFRSLASSDSRVTSADAAQLSSYLRDELTIQDVVQQRLVEKERLIVKQDTAGLQALLAHVPAVAVVALYPSAPPNWLPGFPYGAGPAPGWEGGLRNSTAAAVSLHVGIPLLLALAAVWMRPRAPLAWALWIFPATVVLVVVGTGHHLFADAVIAGLCAVSGWWAARRLHGPVGHAAPRGAPGAIAAVSGGCALAVMAIARTLFGGLA